MKKIAWEYMAVVIIVLGFFTVLFFALNSFEVEDKYIDNQIAWVKKYFDAEIRSIREAVDKVEATNKAKFEAQNEWRQQFKDQTSTFLTRREMIIIALAVIGFLITILLYKK